MTRSRSRSVPLLQLITSSGIERLTLGGAADVLGQLIDQFQRADHNCNPRATELSHISVVCDPLDERDIDSCSERLRPVTELWNFVSTTPR